MIDSLRKNMRKMIFYLNATKKKKKKKEMKMLRKKIFHLILISQKSFLYS